MILSLVNFAGVLILGLPNFLSCVLPPSLAIPEVLRSMEVSVY